MQNLPVSLEKNIVDKNTTFSGACCIGWANIYFYSSNLRKFKEVGLLVSNSKKLFFVCCHLCGNRCKRNQEKKTISNEPSYSEGLLTNILKSVVLKNAHGFTESGHLCQMHPRTELTIKLVP